MLFPDTQHLKHFEKGICLANFRKLPSSSLSLSLFLSVGGLMMRGGGGGGAFPWPPESGIHKEHEGLGLLIQDKPTLFTLISTGLPTHKIETRRTSRQDNSNRNLPQPQSQRRCHTLAHRYTNTFSHTHTRAHWRANSLSLFLSRSLTLLSLPSTHAHHYSISASDWQGNGGESRNECEDLDAGDCAGGFSAVFSQCW